MKRVSSLVLFMTLMASSLFAQVYPQNYVTVNGEVSDSTTQVWGYGSVTLTLYNPSSIQQPVWTQTGIPLTPAELTLTQQLDQNGDFTYPQNVPDNLSISPAGSSWKVTVCASATAPCQTSTNGTFISGSDPVAITDFITGFIQPLQITPGILTLAYSQSEIVNPVAGSAYIESDPNASDYLSLYSFDGLEWNLIVDSSGGATNCTTNSFGDYICSDPTGGQGIVQPAGTNFQGTGQFSFGYPSNNDLYLGGGAQANDSSDNVDIGFDSFSNVTDVNNSVVIGYGAANSDTSGTGDTLIGYLIAPNYNNTSNGNTCVGSQAIGGGNPDTTGGNTCIGFEALSATLGHLNVALGAHSNGGSQGSNNVTIGPYSGSENTSTSYSDQFFVSSTGTQYTTLSQMESNSLLWGTFSGSPSSTAGQQITVNGLLHAALGINIEGGTLLTSESSSGSQVVNCAPKGASPSTDYCGADGTWQAAATPYTPPAFTGTLGYQASASGTIEEWVEGPSESANFSGPVTITLPLTFPHACFLTSAQISTFVSSSPTGNGSAYTNYAQSCTTSTITVWMDVGPDGVGSASHAALVRILGW